MNVDAVVAAPASATIRVVLLRAKFNNKYKKRKGKSKPRINRDDLNVLTLMSQHTLVTFEYNQDTNDLVFDTHISPSDELKNDIIVDGEDTGGQIVRTCLQLAIQISGGRRASLPTLEIPSREKACMLYVQASMFTLEIGESFTIYGGSPRNRDAPSPAEYRHIFGALRKFLGVSFRLDDETSSVPTSSSTAPASSTKKSTLSPSRFVLTRDEDVQPAVDPSKFDCEPPMTYFMMDQLLMGLALVKTAPTQAIQLVCDYNEDYHISAMVKILRLLGHQVADERKGVQRKIAIQLRRKENNILKIKLL